MHLIVSRKNARIENVPIPPRQEPHRPLLGINTKVIASPRLGSTTVVHRGYQVFGAFICCLSLSQRWNQPQLMERGKREVGQWRKGKGEEIEICYVPESVSDTLLVASVTVSWADWRYDFPVFSALSVLEPETVSEAF